MNEGTPHPSHKADIAALLRWFAEAGVDAVLQEEARDRFAETARESEARGAKPQPRTPPRIDAQPVQRAPAHTAAPPVAAAGAQPLASPRTTSGNEAARSAESLAAEANSLEELEAALGGFEGCGLKATARSLVFGNGAPDAQLMIVGEAPGREEDAAGLPFVGRSGRLLDRMLQAIGLEREAVRVTNTVPWRPPGNRTPTPMETELCRPFLMRHIELVRPRVLVCVGSPSAKILLRTDEGIMRLRGRWTTVPLGSGEEVDATAMLHPAYLLRQPAQKRLAWRDLLSIRERLANPGTV